MHLCNYKIHIPLKLYTHSVVLLHTHDVAHVCLPSGGLLIYNLVLKLCKQLKKGLFAEV